MIDFDLHSSDERTPLMVTTVSSVPIDVLQSDIAIAIKQKLPDETDVHITKSVYNKLSMGNIWAASVGRNSADLYFARHDTLFCQHSVDWKCNSTCSEEKGKRIDARDCSVTNNINFTLYCYMYNNVIG